ncbi:hypothetical protein, partial [Janthinobacterium sp.]|uniref:hypothetical protein n=1 Tax=Janthinobacterium sp. TaxID=1871054 RepID=UPI00289C7A99
VYTGRGAADAAPGPAYRDRSDKLTHSHRLRRAPAVPLFPSRPSQQSFPASTMASLPLFFVSAIFIFVAPKETRRLAGRLPAPGNRWTPILPEKNCKNLNPITIVIRTSQAAL